MVGSGAETQAPGEVLHYVQLVRGSDLSTPPTPSATPVGLKIRQRLEPRFRWKSYWEVQRAKLGVSPGKTGRIQLQEGHSLEIDLRNPEKRTVRLYRDQKLVRTAVCSRTRQFCIEGVEAPDGTVWFIIVRTDPPAT